MSDPVQPLLDEHAQLQRELADPAVHADAGKARKLGRRYSELNGIVEAHRRVEQLSEDLEATRELGSMDPELAAEIEPLEAALESAQEALRRKLIPRDPDDGRNVILEIKAGEGGDESALFAGDLLRMYMRYAESLKFKTEVLSSTPTELGGYKDVQLAVKSSSNDPAHGAWARLKYERPRTRSLGAAEIRRRRAPRPACSRH